MDSSYQIWAEKLRSIFGTYLNSGEAAHLSIIAPSECRPEEVCVDGFLLEMNLISNLRVLLLCLRLVIIVFLPSVLSREDWLLLSFLATLNAPPHLLDMSAYAYLRSCPIYQSSSKLP